jgi:hypothetical protein
MAAAWRDRLGGYTVHEDHRPHLEEALGWLERAQDANPDGGFARGYTLKWHKRFKRSGWQPSYPETTGYIIPTFYAVGRHLSRPALKERAERAARWEIDVQLESGAVRGGVIGQAVSPAVFNTGQVLFGWLAAHQETGDSAFADAALRAGRYLASRLDEDGYWRRGTSQFARGDTTLYNARTAWGLAECGVSAGETELSDAAARALLTVVEKQRPNGWIPDCCLSDPERPLLHTLAYALRGLLEGGRVLEDDRLIAAARLGAERLADAVRQDGWMPGRFDANWSPAASWSCLTGEAQSVNIWIRLYLITGERSWLEPVPRVLRFLKSTQDTVGSSPGTRGGIKGSAPVSGDYGSYQILNWATKFFADALLRHERVSDGSLTTVEEDYTLA